MWLMPSSILLLGIAATLIGVLLLPYLRGAEESAQRALLAQACELLETHYREHSSFPESLAALPLTFRDGGPPETLRGFEYSHSDSSARISVVGAYQEREFSCVYPKPGANPQRVSRRMVRRPTSRFSGPVHSTAQSIVIALGHPSTSLSEPVIGPGR